MTEDDYKYLDGKFSDVHKRLDATDKHVAEVSERTARIEGKVENGIVTKESCDAKSKAEHERIKGIEERQKSMNTRLWGALILAVVTLGGVVAKLLMG